MVKNRASKKKAAKELTQRIRAYERIHFTNFDAMWTEHTFIAGYIKCMLCSGMINREKEDFLFEKLDRIENKKIVKI